LRVIAGVVKGRRLKAPKGLKTRPTSDRTKESLFNIIGSRIVNAKFLDLYAGTGAISIEAISRGAERSVLVENDPRAIKVIRENLQLTGLDDYAEILSQSVESAIKSLSVKDMTFDIIFMDPPYLKGLIEPCLTEINKGKVLASGGLIIAESSKLDVLPESVGSFRLFRKEKYGDTVLSFYQES